MTAFSSGAAVAGCTAWRPPNLVPFCWRRTYYRRWSVGCIADSLPLRRKLCARDVLIKSSRMAKIPGAIPRLTGHPRIAVAPTCFARAIDRPYLSFQKRLLTCPRHRALCKIIYSLHCRSRFSIACSRDSNGCHCPWAKSCMSPETSCATSISRPIPSFHCSM